MMTSRRSLLSAAVLLALAASPAHAVLERFGPINKAPTVGGFPAWAQDKTGITMEFCDLLSAAERDGGWCVATDGNVPEEFPLNFGGEHFYYSADNDMRDAGTGIRARVVIAIEAGFSNGLVALDGDQMVFGRLRTVVTGLPFDGDYRVITPYSDETYTDQLAGGKISVTADIGLACVGTFDCALKSAVGPFLLPSAVPGGAEVPPWPDILSAPPGTDPFYDAQVALGGPSPDPHTGKKYITDPGRVGTVTGSALPDFTANEVNGTSGKRNHNTFRIEVRQPSLLHDGPVIFTMEGEANFVLAGRLMTGTLPGKVTPTRASYKADAVGNVTALDVFANGFPTTQARLPAQPQLPQVMPVLSYYDTPCGGAIGADPETGLPIVNRPPYTAPAGTARPMARQGTTFWGQSQPGGLPPSHVCIVDAAARDTAGQATPAYYLQKLSDTVTIGSASFDGPNNGKLAVTAMSSDPTAVLTLTGYGPSRPEAPGTATAADAGTGLNLAGGAGNVTGLLASPATLQIVSSKGGAASREVETALGMTTGGTGGTGGTTDPTAPPVIGTPVAVNDSATLFEDCSQTTSDMCGPGLSLAYDLIGNDTVSVNGQAVLLRDFVRRGLGTVTVSALAPRLGLANMTGDGLLTYIPNPNESGTDSLSYTVSVNGKVSNQAILTINITPVNDVPYAVNSSAGAVLNKPATLNLMASSSDPDGPADLKDAVIVSWPAQLGARPTPVDGSISFTPTTAGTFSIIYQVKDAAGALSPNTATAPVTVSLSEGIAFTKTDFVAAQTRWTLAGTDTVRAGQTLTLVYGDGKPRGDVACNGTATSASCVIGTAAVGPTGAWTLDRIVTAGSSLDPLSTGYWQKLPTTVKAFSSAPALGGTGTGTIVKK
jgi:hypothetical protein